MSQKGDGENNYRLFGVLLAMTVVLLLAAVFTLDSIEKTMQPVLQNDGEASPLGYTRSLSLVYLPICVLLWWFWKHPDHQPADRVGLKHTLYFLVPLWSLVDILAAPSIFRFPNCKATLEWYVPAWLPGQGFSGRVPVEEFFFYLGASLLFLLLYLWGKAVWFVQPPATQSLPERARASVPVVTFRWWGLALMLALITIAALVKYGLGIVAPLPVANSSCNIPQTDFSGVGFPLYFSLLLLIALGPITLLWQKMIPLINNQAMLLTVLVGVLVSLMWEATLALPYGWWDYNDYWMLGLYIKPWFGLPIEAALLWFCGGVGSVVLFELFKSQYASGLGFWRYLFGPLP